ncbi:MAG: DUF151 domain-containing protein [Candidatus Aenigmatarchaeota archaeon]
MARKNLKKNRRMIVIFSILLVAAIFYVLFRNFLFPEIIEIKELSTIGFVEVGVSVNVSETEGIISLSDGCREIYMSIDTSQAISIENGMNRIIKIRPNTHDLMNDLLEGFGIKVLMVKIVEMRDNTYFSKLILRKGNVILSLDSRPSDAIAIAARTSYMVPIYVKEDLLEEYGKKIC